VSAAFDAVLFDFGGVFIESPFAVADLAAERLGVPLADLSAVMFGSYDNDDDHPWHRLERGEITFDDARREIGAAASAAGLGDLDPFDVLASMAASTHGPRGFVVDFVREVRGMGLKTAVVTNNVAEFASFWRPILPLDDLFDDVVDSSAVGVRKPNPAIYELACDRLGVEASRSLFVDDYEGNVVGARVAGLVAVCCGYSVETTAAAIEMLRGLLRDGG